MIPKITSASDVAVEQYKTKTYRIDFANKRIVGMIDNLDASVQAAHKILLTERYSERIYSGDYGVELQRLIGASMPFVEANIKTTIEEALTPDGRFDEITHVSIERTDCDTLRVDFSVTTIDGETDTSIRLGV